ncbi:type II toxin-antitoxin system RelE/ParE family toxin [Nostoc sp. FACHB-152]|uniref:type II toxin-antitoxin system RelE/ParE family toxin n=1 Tax=unclassified Nostoc TaxID=2593658 RepID=UPI0016831984|nr:MULTISPECIES: type II toxin-antitoxin system RelE/ParE family toxin [unclassified Nostoc]MBD2447545.1 type II toxin-antitoxin system RelE/ParE family toxin [Nostoc sp. FACHB-152]MBD2469315.1 type II toxin-antitoxin system RelE/ParE family toxin [Nostoc sp. FACHB-145]
MKQHIISPAASLDLAEIIDYFTIRNIEAGERFIDEFEKKCKYLANFPNMGRSYANINNDLRGVPLDGYIILYRIIDSGIEIVRVVSGYRNLESLFAEDN